MLIDCSYFTCGPRHILNATLGRVPNPNAEEVNAAIVAYIRMLQPIFLKGVLGQAACAVSAYLEVDKEEYPEQTNAAIETVIDRLREPFANYVFFKILRDSNTQATMTGIVRLKCANDYVAPIRRQVSAWNDMVDMLAAFLAWSQTPDCPITGIIIEPNFLTKINCMNL